MGSEDIEGAITQAISGISDPGPYTVTVKGINVSNDAVIKNLIYGIVAGQWLKFFPKKLIRTIFAKAPCFGILIGACLTSNECEPKTAL
ncbi:MAG: hypothetical protein LBQ57_05295 [Spirochaetales bacterium]|jgi:hypothetical protein|nr:hypothetical protein [Spirochaetales bacterium]